MLRRVEVQPARLDRGRERRRQAGVDPTEGGGTHGRVLGQELVVCSADVLRAQLRQHHVPELGNQVVVDVLAVSAGGGCPDRLAYRGGAGDLRLLGQPVGEPVAGGLSAFDLLAATRACAQAIELGLCLCLGGETTALQLAAPAIGTDGQRHDEVPGAVTLLPQLRAPLPQLAATGIATGAPLERRSPHHVSSRRGEGEPGAVIPLRRPRVVGSRKPHRLALATMLRAVSMGTSNAWATALVGFVGAAA
ncbi:hypothetical protein BH24ACT12_BH24ACT12_14120 [soil metagenome]